MIKEVYPSVATYSRFEKLIDEAIPLVDGDAPGRVYIAELIGLKNPPSIILNMGYNREPEDLISWVVQPQTEGRQAELEALLEPFDTRSLWEILSFLYPIVVVDEFQDCEGVFPDIIKKLSNCGSLFKAADDF
ncbi:MAG: hypothetical protein R6U62_06320 [Bacteroidales bacterium]